MLTGRQVRDACELLRWSRHDLQRRTALPVSVVDRALASRDGAGEILSDDIVLRDAFHRAGVGFAPGGSVRLRSLDRKDS